MKALVLSGGHGTRLRPFTYAIPKQLVPVANKPVLRHCLETVRDIGVTEVGLIVGNGADQIRAAIGDGSTIGIRVTYIQQNEPAGLAHCVKIARDFLKDDPFVMYLGDNIFLGGIGSAAASFRAQRPDAKILITKVDNPQQYGIVEVDAEGRVTSLVEKPSHPQSDLAITGVYFFSPAIHESVRRIRPSRRGELEITDAIQDLLERGHTVNADVYDGYWKDTGSVDDLLECNRAVLETLRSDQRGEVDAESRIDGEVVIEPGARVIRSRLDGPIIIGAGTVVTDSVVGPHTAIGRDCVVSAAEIAASVLFNGASVRGLSGIRDSLIGRDAAVHARDKEPHHRLLVGDRTLIETAG